MAATLPGMGSAASLPGGDPVLSDAGGFVGRLISEAIGEQQAAAIMSGGAGMEDAVAKVAEEMITAATTVALEALNNTASGRQQLRSLSDAINSGAGAAAFGDLFGPAATTAPQPQASNPVLSPTESAAPPSPQSKYTTNRNSPDYDPKTNPWDYLNYVGQRAASTPTPEQDPATTPGDIASKFKSSLGEGQHMTMGSAFKTVAKKAGGALAKPISEMQSEWSPSVHGGKEYLTRTIDGGRTEYVPAYNPDGEQNARFGKIAARLALKSDLQSTAVGALTGTNLGSLGKAVGRAAGPIGLAIGATQATGNFMESQNAKATPWRAISGEDTSPFAIKERAGSWMSGLSGFGTIGADEARRQYMAASEMGLTGRNRSNATGFMSDMMGKYGMSTDQSSEITDSLVRASGGGTENLNKFADAIEAVSESAVAAGRTAKEAIAGFSEAVGAAKGLTVDGGAQIDIAKSAADFAGSMGKDLKAAWGGPKGVTNMLKDQNVVMGIAAMTGADPMATMAGLSNPTTGGDTASGLLDAVQQRIMVEAAKVFGYPDVAEFSAELKKRAGGKLPSAAKQVSILMELAGSESAYGQHMMTLSGVVSSIATQMGALDIPALLFDFAINKGTSTATPTESGRLGSGKKPGKDSLDKYTAGRSADYSGVVKSDKAKGAFEQQATAATIGRSILGNPDPRSGATFYPHGSGDSFGAYIESVFEGGGKGNSLVEMMMSNSGGTKKSILDAAGQKSLDDVKFRIDDASGKNQTLTLPEIIKQGLTGNLADADIVRKNSKEAPASLALTIGLDPDAKELVTAGRGPTSDQRSGTPPKSAPLGSPRNYGGL